MDEFGCFCDSESLDDAPLFEATTDSAPVCLKRPLRPPRARQTIVIAEYRIAFPRAMWLGNPRQTNGPPQLAA